MVHSTQLMGADPDLTRALQCVLLAPPHERDGLLEELVKILAAVNTDITRQIVSKIRAPDVACRGWFILAVITRDTLDVAKGREAARRLYALKDGPPNVDTTDPVDGAQLMAELGDRLQAIADAPSGQELFPGQRVDEGNRTIEGIDPSEFEALFAEHFGPREEDDEGDDDAEENAVLAQDYIRAFDALDQLIAGHPDEARRAIDNIESELFYLELLATAAFLSERPEDQVFFEEEARGLLDRARAQLPEGQEDMFTRLIEEMLLPRADRERWAAMLPLAIARFARLSALRVTGSILFDEVKIIAVTGGAAEARARIDECQPLESEQLTEFHGAIAIGYARLGETAKARACLHNPVRPLSPADEMVVRAYLYAAAHTA